jgi:hypothetical protein
MKNDSPLYYCSEAFDKCHFWQDYERFPAKLTGPPCGQSLIISLLSLVKYNHRLALILNNTK